MKHIMALLTIAACLLLPSAGAVFAADKKTQTTGQPGAVSGTTCGMGTAMFTPGQAASANGSPFNQTPSKAKEYAGNLGSPTAAVATPGEPMPNGNANTATAVSEYDVACLNQTTKK